MLLKLFRRVAFVIALYLIHLSFVMASENVVIERIPNNGVQPQLVSDKNGTIHAVWLAGPPAASNVFYAQRDVGATTFSNPIPVHTQKGQAVAMGTIRGAQIAVNKDGRVHVLWNGSRDSQPKGPDGGPGLLYTRMNDAGTAFESVQQLITAAGGLDGGGALIIDNDDRVWALWHASAGAKDESGRGIYATVSSDNGKTFTKENRISPLTNGVCGCCGMQAGVSAQGTIYVLYRSAGNGSRDEMLLTKSVKQQNFTSQIIDPWAIEACPMSTSSFQAYDKFNVLGWETKGRVYVAFEQDGKMSKPQTVPGKKTPFKHPATATNNRGETMVVWTEGTGWNKGGAIAWQQYDATGKPIGSVGRQEDLPIWGLVAVAALKDGRFLILY